MVRRLGERFGDPLMGVGFAIVAGIQIAAEDTLSIADRIGAAAVAVAVAIALAQRRRYPLVLAARDHRVSARTTDHSDGRRRHGVRHRDHHRHLHVRRAPGGSRPAPGRRPRGGDGRLPPGHGGSGLRRRRLLLAAVRRPVDRRAHDAGQPPAPGAVGGPGGPARAPARRAGAHRRRRRASARSRASCTTWWRTRSPSIVLQARGGRRADRHASPRRPARRSTRSRRPSRQALDEMRRLLGVLLRPATTSHAAPQPTLARLEELVADLRASGLPVELARRGRAARCCRRASTCRPTASCRRR